MATNENTPPAGIPTFPELTIGQQAAEILQNLKTAEPFDTTFLFLEAGCGDVGQSTPLAKAIEDAMRKRFQIWASTWIVPHAEDIAIKAAAADQQRGDLVAALRVLSLDPRIRAWLEANDPKALEQAEGVLAKVRA